MDWLENETWLDADATWLDPSLIPAIMPLMGFEILPAIKQTADLVQEIAVASEQQDSGINQINIGMNQLSEITTQNSATSEELASTADGLNKNAEELKKDIGFFTV